MESKSIGHWFFFSKLKLIIISLKAIQIDFFLFIFVLSLKSSIPIQEYIKTYTDTNLSLFLIVFKTKKSKIALFGRFSESFDKKLQGYMYNIDVNLFLNKKF